MPKRAKKLLGILVALCALSLALNIMQIASAVKHTDATPATEASAKEAEKAKAELKTELKKRDATIDSLNKVVSQQRDSLRPKEDTVHTQKDQN